MLTGRMADLRPVPVRDRAAYRARMNDMLRVRSARTVVLTVDMQRDYLDFEIGSSPLATADSERVMRSTQRLLAVARGLGIPVIHTYVQRRPVEIALGLEGAPLGRLGRRHGLSQNAQAGVRRIPDRLEGSPQAELPSSLCAPSDLHVTSKKTMDPFLGTELELLLARLFRPETLVLSGINTDTCVYAAAFAAANRGYQPVVVADCVASIRGADHHWMALELMSRSIAWVLSLEELVAKFAEAMDPAAPDASDHSPGPEPAHATPPGGH